MGRRIVMPGGTGFLGRHLGAALVERGDEVVALTRGPATTRDGIRQVTWDARTLGPWVEVLEGADAIIHLSGKRVDTRPTRRNLAQLIDSRVVPVALVGRALHEVSSPPPVWLQAATLAIHGDGGDRLIDDATPPPTDGPPQMTGVATAWEQAYRSATGSVPRTVLLRMGVAIGGDDPATEQLARLARWGLGGAIGGGRQWLSWIALADLRRAVLRLLDDETATGTYAVTSPEPVTNAEAMATIRRVVGRRVGLPSPALLTRVGAFVLGSDPALALTGRRAVPSRLLEDGFVFEVPRFEDAVRVALAD